MVNTMVYSDGKTMPDGKTMVYSNGKTIVYSDGKTMPHGNTVVYSNGNTVVYSDGNTMACSIVKTLSHLAGNTMVHSVVFWVSRTVIEGFCRLYTTTTDKLAVHFVSHH